MRELKFRVLLRKKLYYDINDLYWFEENYIHKNGDEKCIITQFTGMKDRNGRDIYEGDILRLVIRKGVSKKDFKVVFDAPSFKALWNDVVMLGVNDWSECEIVGTIFDKELE